MKKKTDLKVYLIELWHAFERTGSIGAYLLYNDLRKKAEKAGSARKKRVFSKDNA